MARVHAQPPSVSGCGQPRKGVFLGQEALCSRSTLELRAGVKSPSLKGDMGSAFPLLTPREKLEEADYFH